MSDPLEWVRVSAPGGGTAHLARIGDVKGFVLCGLQWRHPTEVIWEIALPGQHDVCPECAREAQLVLKRRKRPRSGERGRIG